MALHAGQYEQSILIGCLWLSPISSSAPLVHPTVILVVIKVEFIIIFLQSFFLLDRCQMLRKWIATKNKNYLFIFFKIVERWKERSNWIVANKNIKNISFILFRWRASKLASGQETTHNHSLSHTNTLSSFIRSTSLSLSLTQVYFSIPT